jgi:hypothetical protein
MYRLNPSQAVNQQVVLKTVPKQSCCNAASLASGNHKLTEYFPVRRSVRKTKTTVLEEQQRDLEEAILSQKEDGLEVVCTQFVLCYLNCICDIALEKEIVVKWEKCETKSSVSFLLGYLMILFICIDCGVK